LEPRLDGVVSVAVAGPDPEAVLLASWLRTSLPGATVEQEEEAPLLSAALEGPDWRVEVRHGPDCLSARLERDGHEEWTTAATPPSSRTEALLGHALQHLQPDAVYDRTLAAAASGS
ncbi:MAG TPA: OpcA/G6PD domain-containing protein, partial [Acidimicrobiales bacterium]|nr:OpcA/G6PD domain-containing protein [Acidimicrobiales bacterium]